MALKFGLGGAGFGGNSERFLGMPPCVNHETWRSLQLAASRNSMTIKGLF